MHLTSITWTVIEHTFALQLYKTVNLIYLWHDLTTTELQQLLALANFQKKGEAT